MQKMFTQSPTCWRTRLCSRTSKSAVGCRHFSTAGRLALTPVAERIPPVPELPSTLGSGYVIGSAYVIGGGRMGAGIAHALLMTGARVTVVEPDARLAEE